MQYRRGVADDEELLELDGHEVRLSSPGKVLFAERGETKRDLVEYYLRVREPLLRTMGGRPVLMQRFPQGAGGPSFFQKRVPKNAPDWLETTTVMTVNGTPSRALVIADLAHVAWAVNLGCLGFHVWPFRAADPEHCDELRLDLDPQPGTDFADVRAARPRRSRRCSTSSASPATRRRRATAGCTSTSGCEPRWDSYAVRSAAVAAARELERRRPDVITAAWWKEERGERIFVDYNQNAPHKTVFGAWGVRARPGGQVSTPLRWEEVFDAAPGRADAGDGARAARARATRGRTSTTRRSRSSRCWRCTSATARTACSTRRGRRSTRRCPTSRRASRRAGRRSSPDRGGVLDTLRQTAFRNLWIGQSLSGCASAPRARPSGRPAPASCPRRCPRS